MKKIKSLNILTLVLAASLMSPISFGAAEESAGASGTGGAGGGCGGGGEGEKQPSNAKLVRLPSKKLRGRMIGPGCSGGWGSVEWPGRCGLRGRL